MTRFEHVTFLCIFSLALFLFGSITVPAQSALDGFDPNANNTVRVIIVQPDGKILIGGNFTTLAPNGGPTVTRNRIARLNADGTLDTAFNPNANGFIFTMALQADGKILVSGFFSIIGGQARTVMARLDAVTGLADSFNPNPDGLISSIAVQADGNILVGGTFSSIGGQARSGMARLDPATGAADSFDPSASGGTEVAEIVIQPDGKILAGGQFTSIGGQTRNHIARLDPLTGLADSFNPNPDNTISAIALQADGKILASGLFTTIGGQTRNRIARLFPATGSADAFNPNANADVDALAVQPDGKILAGGAFSTLGGTGYNRIARIKPDGTVDTIFDPNASGSVSVLAIALQSDGKILIGGSFTTLSPNGGAALTRNRIARLESDGRTDRTLNDLNLGNNGDVYATAIQPDGKILIGGGFTSVLGATRNHIARLNSDGTLDSGFNPNATGDVVLSIAVQSDGKILVGGGFTTIGGQPRNNIARLQATGAADTWNPDANIFVVSISVQANGQILVSGLFTSVGGTTRNRIARLDPVTGLADAFNPNANAIVNGSIISSDGLVLVGGQFTGIGGQTRNLIARLDSVSGAADSFNPNGLSAAPTPSVGPIEEQQDGKILVGGVFDSIGGQARNYIARLNATSGVADSFNPNASSHVQSLNLQSDGKILVGGNFTSIGGAARGRIARLDPVTGSSDSWNPGADLLVQGTAIQADGKILVGGRFSSIGGQTKQGFARLSNDTVATQNLVVSHNAITWTRSGSGPQFARVTFEDSTDGVNYNFLGTGIRSGSNWILTCLNLSTGQNIYIRARGYYRTGYLNGSESIQESVRNAFLAPGPTISGTVTYGNAIGAPTPRFVSNVLISGAGSPNVMTTTTSPGPCTGTYSLTGFGSGSYTVTPTKTGGVNGITSFDAAKVAAHVSGTSFLTGNQLLVADVSGNGMISSFDAAQIARYVTSTPPFGITGTWKFVPANRSYSSITSSASGEDFIALLMGDVSGNWTNTSALNRK